MKTSQIVIFFAITIGATSESGHSSISSFGNSNSAVAEARGAEGCHLPSRWEGKFFQSGVHQTITINRNTISTKGKCLEADGEKYLLFNERDSCYRCVVFHEKHQNVLQYKETFCVPERRSIPSLCSTITGDANLFSMFRVDAAAIDCPFRPPFSFTYNRGHGNCRNPVSTIDSCIHSSRILLNYQACPDVPGTESTSEELQCLAMWKEGSSRYLLGLIQYQHHSSFEERFRCFVYEKIKKMASASSNNGHFNNSDGTVMFRVAQSGDATCNGLTPMEGSRTMLLRRSASIPKPCQFPSWLQLHAQWHSLDQRSTFIFNTSSLRVSNSTDITGIGPSTLTMTATCSQILENPMLDNVRLVLHTTSECRSGYLCMAIYRRDGHIVELQMGSITRRVDDACHPPYFNQSLPYITLVSTNPASRRCPNLGRFAVTGFVREGSKYSDKKCSGGFNSLSVGCNTLDTLQFRSECTNADVVAEYSCHGWWEEHGVSYLITTPLSRKSTGARRYCFIFREIPTPFQSKRYIQHQSNNYIGTDEFSLGTEDSISDFGRVLQFSSIADSCPRRNAGMGIEGSLAFNVTSHGRCDDINSSIDIHTTSSQSLQIIIFSVFFLFNLQLQLP